MAPRPVRLFISHSSPTADAADRLAAIVAVFKAERAEVLHDGGEIAGGDDWRAKINAMLLECDAAIILFTADALTSPWVLKEATILSWRRDRDPAFPLIPVLLDDVSLSDLESERWDPLNLTALQVVSGTVDEIATEARQLLAVRVENLKRSPLDLLAAAIAGRLATANDDLLTELLPSLGEPLPPALDERPLRLQSVLARWMLKQKPPALRRLADALRELGPMFDLADRRAIIKAVAPLWVSVETASWFVRFGPHFDDRRHLALGCELPDMTIKDLMYVGSLPAGPRPLFFLKGDAQPEGIVSELVELVRKGLEDSGEPRTHEAARAWLTGGNADVIAALPVGADPTVLDDVRALLPNVTFIFHVAPPAPPPERNALGAGVAAARPLVDAQLERAVDDDRMNALSNA